MKSSNSYIGTGVENQATGCDDASGYAEYAEKLGYRFIEVVDWTSSAGDWTFAVSKDGDEWKLMCQTNNYPQPGFTREIVDEFTYYGCASDVLQQIESEQY